MQSIPVDPSGPVAQRRSGFVEALGAFARQHRAMPPLILASTSPYRKELLARLGLSQGDHVLVTEGPDGLRISRYVPELEEGLEIARKAMKTYRAALTELAK